MFFFLKFEIMFSNLLQFWPLDRSTWLSTDLTWWRVNFDELACWKFFFFFSQMWQSMDSKNLRKCVEIDVKQWATTIFRLFNKNWVLIQSYIKSEIDYISTWKYPNKLKYLFTRHKSIINRYKLLWNKKYNDNKTYQEVNVIALTTDWQHYVLTKYSFKINKI